MTVLDTVTISTCGLAALIREAPDTTLVVDCRGFTEYNESHVRHSMNAFFSKLIRRRLFENKVSRFFFGKIFVFHYLLVTCFFLLFSLNNHISIE